MSLIYLRMYRNSRFLLQNNVEMDNKYKHLCMIEDIIERMAKNSFSLKGWAMTLVVLIGGFVSQASNQKYIVIAFLPILGFWLLDAYYLQMERRYRILYKNVQRKEESEIDFSLNTTDIVMIESNINKLSYFQCLFSTTELVFYGSILLSMMIMVFLLFKVI